MNPPDSPENPTLENLLHDSFQDFTAAQLGMEVLLRRVRADPAVPPYVSERIALLLDTLRASADGLTFLAKQPISSPRSSDIP